MHLHPRLALQSSIHPAWFSSPLVFGVAAGNQRHVLFWAPKSSLQLQTSTDTLGIWCVPQVYELASGQIVTVSGWRRNLYQTNSKTVKDTSTSSLPSPSGSSVCRCYLTLQTDSSSGSWKLKAGDGMFRSISEDWVFQCKFCFWIFYYVTNVLFIVPLGGGFCWCDGMTTQYMSDGANSALNLLQDFSIMAGWFQLISRVWNLKLKRSLTNLSKPCFKRWKNHVWQDSLVFEIRDETDKAQMKIPKLVLEPADASAAAR